MRRCPCSPHRPPGRWHLGGFDLAPTSAANWRRRPLGPLGILSACSLGVLASSPVPAARQQESRLAMPIDPSELAQSIGALDSLNPQQGLAPTLQQVTDGAKQLFGADGAGLMLVDQEGQLRWASASDQTTQNVEDEQERLAQGPCAVAFSQRLPAAIRDLRTEPDW